MNATEIRNEIRRLEETGRRCTTERDAHLVDQEIVRLEAALRGYENGMRDALTGPDEPPANAPEGLPGEDGADYDQAHPAVHDETAPAREAAGGPRAREGADPRVDAKIRRRRALAWRLAHQGADLGAITNEEIDTPEIRAEIRRQIAAIRHLVLAMENAIDPNYA